MKRRVKFRIVSVTALLIVLGAGYLYQHSVAFVRAAPEDRYGLWMAALKGFQGTPRYVGSLGDYSYFRVGDVICSRYKAPTAKLHLPSTFPLGQGTPYVVTFEMVPSSP
jgi:hypothetical protein